MDVQNSHYSSYHHHRLWSHDRRRDRNPIIIIIIIRLLFDAVTDSHTESWSPVKLQWKQIQQWHHRLPEWWFLAALPIYTYRVAHCFLISFHCFLYFYVLTSLTLLMCLHCFKKASRGASALRITFCTSLQSSSPLSFLYRNLMDLD